MSTPTIPRRPLHALPLPSEIIDSGRSAIVWRWILSRALTLSLLATEVGVGDDVFYYAGNLHNFFHGGTLGSTLPEYPLPVLGLLMPQYVLGFLHQSSFVLLFVASMLAIDAAFTAALWRGDGRRRGDATNLWLWFVPLIGPLAYFRFDLVPAILAGGAVLVAIRRPALAGALTAIGAAIKLWPAAMMPTFMIRRTDRTAVLTGFAATGALLALVTVVIGGLSRATTPISWQNQRGLQVESVLASPLLVARVFASTRWDVHLSQWKAFEVFGPGVHVMETLSTLATVLGGLTLILLWWRGVRMPVASAETLGWMFLSTTLIVTITNKTLSPQYLLWLGGPVSALAVRAQASPSVRHFGRALLVTALLTQLEYPVFYHPIVRGGSLLPLGTAVLVARNVLMVYLTWYAVRQVWVRTDLRSQRIERPVEVTTA